MIPEYPKFKPLELSDRAGFEKRLSEHPVRACELAFTNLYIWKDFDNPRITTIGENICVLLEPPNESKYFLEPLGDYRLDETVETCLDETGRISRASREFISRIRRDKFEVKMMRDQHDYIYRVEELAELSGRRYDGKRNHINAFRKRCPDYKIIDLDGSFKSESIDIYDRWSRSKDGSFESELAVECQRKALENAFDAYRDLDILGSGIVVEGELKAFMLASRQCHNTVCTPLSYHTNEIQGLSHTLLWETCRGLFSGFEYVNMEQDLGIAGLRKYKKSYYPYRMEEKFDVRRR
jgi:hypothetical protein